MGYTMNKAMQKFTFNRPFFFALLVLMMFLLGNVGSLQAQDEDNPCQYDDAQSSYFCAQCKLELAMDTLNQVWDQLIKEVPQEIADRLNKAQQHWIALRDGQCDLILDGYGIGSGAGSGWNNCKREMTEQRTQQLRDVGEFYGKHDE